MITTRILTATAELLREALIGMIYHIYMFVMLYVLGLNHSPKCDFLDLQMLTGSIQIRITGTSYPYPQFRSLPYQESKAKH
jgi:hypothetical protein